MPRKEICPCCGRSVENIGSTFLRGERVHGECVYIIWITGREPVKVDAA